MGLGLQIAATMGAFVGGGIALDRALGTTPWLMLAGTVLAFAGVIALVVRLAIVPPPGAPPRKRPPGPPVP
ncbi:MAG: AtpZ/AtpI family protein [Rubricoccaceae bacterium]